MATQQASVWAEFRSQTLEHVFNQQVAWLVINLIKKPSFLIAS
jgi:hypothetical protein